MWDYDVIIVGAGPAGCGAAYDLCEKGFSVLLLDRSEFPRHKPCAGGLTIKSLRTLRYTVKPVIRNICTDIRISDKQNPYRTFQCQTPIVAMTVREEFDKYCLEKTVDKGANFELIKSIKAISQGEKEVVVATDKNTFTARYLIGADGANSTVRKLSGAFAKVKKGLAIEGLIENASFPTSTMELTFAELKMGYGWVFPKHDHLNVGLYTNDPQSDKINKKALQAYVEPRFGNVEIKHITGHYVGLGGGKELPGSGRILLCGDAAGYVDPIIGEGIYYAIKSGQLAAAAIAKTIDKNELADQCYHELIHPFLYDLRGCYKAADWLYQHLGLAKLGLRYLPAKSIFLKSFAHGLTLSEMKGQMHALPFKKWKAFARLFE
ncbi:MAG: geranylgeranyl reductase family protein [Bacteroidota bacterium]